MGTFQAGWTDGCLLCLSPQQGSARLETPVQTSGCQLRPCQQPLGLWLQLQHPGGAASSHRRVLHPAAGGGRDTPLLPHLFPSTPVWGSVSPRQPRLEGAGRVAELTWSPLPAPRTAPCKRWDRLGGGPGEAAGAAWLQSPLFIRQVGFRQPGGGVGVGWSLGADTHTPPGHRRRGWSSC